ncbi:MAG: carbohydrate kinase [Anaerolineae bacterium]|nr:carbohydrate kinase [Anaerolineae bacterium]
MDIVCMGEVLIDLFPAELGRRLADVSAFYPKPGGAPANVAVAAARLGARSAFIGKVGDEAFGHRLIEVLRREGVDVRGMRLDHEARTTLAFIAQPDENTSEFAFYRNPGADMMLRADELDQALIAEAKVFHFGSISMIDEPVRSATVEAVRTAHAGGAMVSLDVNYRPTLWPSARTAYDRIREAIAFADVVKVNETELALLTRGATGLADPWAGSDAILAAAEHILELGPGLCVVTLGRAGCAFRTAAGGGCVPGFQVETVDATGCGDAFVAGLLCRLVAGGAGARPSPPVLRDALRYANAVGALTSMTRGGIPALPSAAQVAAFLAASGSYPERGI